MSIGGSILNTELYRSHDTFMAQIRSAWRTIRGSSDDVQGKEPEASINPPTNEAKPAETIVYLSDRKF